MKIKILILTLLVLIITSFSCFAATYYMATNGNNTNPGDSDHPWLTLQYSMGHISGGDVLIIKDGVYTGAENSITSANYPPLGSSSAWTVVRAEHDGGTEFDGQNARNMFDFEGSPQNNKYWQFEGIIWSKTTGSNVTLLNSNYVKFLRCGAYEAADGNTCNFFLRDSDYCLLENCYAWGSGRYKFNAYYCDRVVFRNCIGRHDYVYAGTVGDNPIGGFIAYHSTNIIFQNCILLDSDETSTAWVGNKYGAFYVVTNSVTCENIFYKNCVALNCNLAGVASDGGAGLVNFNNCVLWNCIKDPNNTDVNNLIRGFNTQVEYCTFGVATIKSGDFYHFRADYQQSTYIKDSILYGLVNGYVTRDVTVDYNCYHDNTNNNYNGAVGSHSLTTTDPIYNSSTNTLGGLKYITRIESGSNLSGRGEGGLDIGANIKTLIGTSGTLYGETGYATDTTVAMWPFPNEDLIRTKMKAYNLRGVSGNRGFCVDGTTLTKYIWESLGNSIPPEIYGAPVTPTISTSFLAAGATGSAYSQTLVVSGGTAPYSWTVASGSLPAGLNLNISTGVISGTPTTPGTSNFTVQVMDATTATDTQSLSILVSAPDLTAPTISAIASGSITGSGATITWTTNEAATSRVEYGTTTGYGSQTTLDSNLVTSHSVNLTSLTANTTYHYRVKSRDAANNETVSADYTFITGGSTDYVSASPDLNLQNFELIPEEGNMIVNIPVNPATATSAAIILTIYDAENPGEGYFYINGNDQTEIPYGDPYDSVDHTFDPITIDKAHLVQGDNTIRFTHVATSGFQIRDVIIRLTFSGSSDTTAPSAVSSLAAATGANRGEVNLTWSAPGDDAAVGTAASYTIKYSTSAITTDALFNAASTVAGVPAPQVAGTSQSVTIAGFTPGTTYYFAMKAQDEVPNVSALSNSTSAAAKANTMPVLSAIGAKSVNENAALTFTISATDADGDTMTYTATGLQTGASLNSSTGAFSWIPTYSQSGSYSTTFSAADGNGGTASETLTITVANVNRAPVLGVIGARTVAENSALTFTVTATDPDGGALTLSVSNLPSGASFTPGTGAFSWTPSYSQAGTYAAVHFEVTDGSLTDSEDITITVSNTNRAPVLGVVGNQSVSENSNLAFSLSATDADSDTLAYSATGLPSGATLNSSTGAFSWTPTYSQSGTHSVTFSVSDGNGGTDSEAITITVANVNRAPVLGAIGAKSVNENSNLAFTVSATDADPDTLAYSATGLPSGATLNTSTGAFSWTPGYDQSGTYNTTFTVNDGNGGTDSEAIVITVANVNRAPVLAAIGNKIGSETAALSFTVTASDPDGGAVTLSASNLPSGAAFTPATGVFSWTPSFGQQGTYTDVNFAVSDGSLTDTEDITITVTHVNQAPVLGAIGNKSVNEAATLTFTVSATDPDGDPLTYSATSLPSGASLNSSTGAFSWIPSYSQSGVHNVTFSVSDGLSGTDSEAITITVANTNRAPVLAAIGNKTGAENTALTFTVSGIDPDSDAVTLSASNLPSGAAFTPATGVFSWTPSYSQAGTFAGVQFVASDGSLTDTEDITITVSNTNRAPVLAAIGAKSVNENSALTFSVSATDADGDTLAYSAATLPAGATFSGTDFSWTPSYAQAGAYPVTFTVNDGNGGTASEAITVTVANVNRAPVLAAIGAKAGAEAAALTFTVTASDPDADAVTLSVSNLPLGATFTPATGVFTWTPSYTQAGVFNNVNFSVTDGSLTASENITITIANTNRAPVLGAIGNKNVGESATLTFTVTATDPDGDAMTLSASNLPAGATFTAATGAFSWTPTYAQAGTFAGVHFAVTDGTLSDTEDISILVSNTDRPPVLAAIGNRSVNEGATMLVAVSATDPDNDAVTITTTALPAWMSFDGSTLTAAPGYTNSGVYTVIFTASDGTLTDAETISVTVGNVNRAPVLAAIGNKAGAENTALTFTISATDADGDALTYSASNLPSGATFIPATRVFSWTPTYSQAGTYAAVNFQVTDGIATDSETVTLTIADTNQVPVLNSIGAKTVKEQNSLTFTVSATDGDNDTLTYAASSLPSGATFSNGNFAWTPSIGQAGNHSVTFSIADGRGGTDSEAVVITVNALDLQPPYAADLTPAAGEVQVDRNTSVIINVKDDGDGVDKDAISVSILRKGDRAPRQIVKNGVSTLTQYPNAVIVQGTPADYMVKYDPPLKKEYRFSYEQDITVYVSARDLNNNALSNHSYSFTTAMILRGSNKPVSSATTTTAKLGLPAPSFVRTAIAAGVDAATEIASSITLDKSDAKNVYAAWYDESLGSIWTAKSTNRGLTFATKTKVSSLTTGLNQNVAITTDASGNTYVIWQNQQSGADWDLYFARRLAGTSTFETGEIPLDNILGADTEQIEPSIDADADGKVSIAWINQGGGNDGVYFAQSTDKGASFWTVTEDTIKKVDDSTATAVAGSCLKVDSAGDNKYIVWSGVKDGNRKIFFNSFNASNTKGYVADLQVSDDATSDNASHPVIGVPPIVGTDDANICVAWENQQGTDIDIFIDSSETGAVWGTDMQVNDDAQVPQTQKEPVIGVDDDGKVYCAWSDYRNGDWDIYLVISNDKGATFGTNILVNDDGGTAVQARPAMNLSADGKHMCLTWTDYRNSAAWIYFNRNSFYDEDVAQSSHVDHNAGGSVQATTDVDIAGAEVVVPSQFMDASATVSITKVENAPPMDNDQQVPKVIDFGPSGITFNKPATIKIPYSAADLSAAGISDARRLRIFYYNLKTLMWEKLAVSQVDTTNGVVSAEVGHFSLYGLSDGGDISSTAYAATSDTSGVTSGGGGGGGGGCFIATACYGSYDHPYVKILRAYRDKYLLTTTWGTVFVHFYYKHSPPIARYIEKREALKTVVRWMLKPVVAIAAEFESW